MSKNNIKKSLFSSLILVLLTAPVFAQGEYVYDSKGRRDPFIALVTPDGMLVKVDKEEREAGSIAIEGIIYDQHGPSYAIVNAEVVKAGDSLGDGARVLKIEKNKVILSKDGQLMEIILREDKKDEK